MRNSLHGSVTDPAAAKYLANAVDLSALTQPAAPEPAAAEDTTEETPREFRVAIVGDHRGRPHIMLGFGHLQWVFEPHLAEDLGTVLVDAAKQAERMAPHTPDLTPTSADSGLLP